MVLGLTGKYCSGKNTVAEILRRHGFTVIDVDVLGHRALVELKGTVVEHFGPRILGPDGAIDRRRLGAIVFADRSAREDLERIVHPWMVTEVQREVAGADRAGTSRANRSAAPGGSSDHVINAAILFEMGLHRLCSVVIWVHAPLLERIRRARRRDGLSLGEIVRRLWAQRKLSPQPFRGSVDIMSVRNSGRREFLEAQIVEIAARRSHRGEAHGGR